MEMKMDTKKAIKKVKEFLITTRAYEALMTPTEKREHNFELNMVIALLQRGEKFEEIVGEIERGLYSWDSGMYTIPIPFHDDIAERIKRIKQKYFPKEGW